MKFPPTFPGYTRQGSLMVPGYVGRAGRAPGGAAGPTTLLYDTFTDANGTALTAHTMNTGPGWTLVDTNATWQIQSNAARVTTFGGLGFGSIVSDAGQANVTQTGTITLLTGWGVRVGLSGRETDDNNFWRIVARPTNEFEIIQVDTVSGQTVRATTPKTWNVDTAYVFQVIFSGTSVTATVDGGSSINYPDATHNQSATKFGMAWAEANLATIDEFLVTT